MNKGNIRKLYEHTESQKLATKGLIGGLSRLFQREGVPLTKATLYKHCGEFRQERGASFVSRTFALIGGLCAIGKQDRAKYLVAQMAILTDSERRKLSFDELLERFFGKLAELAAAHRSGDYTRRDYVLFELRTLTGAELV